MEEQAACIHVEEGDFGGFLDNVLSFVCLPLSVCLSMGLETSDGF